jgi:predicted nucleic acid-binding protein
MSVLIAMIDTMIFDHLLANPDDRSVVTAAIADGRLQLKTTHVQEDQLAAIPDEAKRSAAAEIPREVVASSVFVVGVSRVGMARVGPGDDYEAIRRAEKDVEDAIIAASAVSEAHVLVTEDKRLAKRARGRLKVQIWTANDLTSWARDESSDLPPTTPLGAAGRLLEESELLDLDQRVAAHAQALSVILDALRELARERRDQRTGFPPPGQVSKL